MPNRVAVHRAIAGGSVDGLDRQLGHAEVIGEINRSSKFKIRTKWSTKVSNSSLATSGWSHFEFAVRPEVE